MTETKRVVSALAEAPAPVGSLAIDCTEMESFLVDLPPGGATGFLPLQQGFDEVVGEILANQRALGERAGVTSHDIEGLETFNRQIDMIETRLPAVLKLAEILQETRAKLENQRQRLVFAI